MKAEQQINTKEITMKSYTHFTTEERESLYLLLKLGKKPSEIARELNRNRSSVSREIKRNKNQNGEYNPVGATRKYQQRRKNSKRKYRIQNGIKTIRKREYHFQQFTMQYIEMYLKMFFQNLI